MFDIFRKVDLSYLGEAWKNCYLTFRPLTILEAQNFVGYEKKDPKVASDDLMKSLEEKFIEGKAISDGKEVEVKKEQLKEFPAGVILDIVKALGEGLPKKKENQSVTV